MAMPTIEIAGKKVLLNIVHHDSGEEPESACTNTLIGAKVGEVTFQYLNIDLKEAVSKMAVAIGSAAMFNPAASAPQMLTVVISKFHRETTIDWKGAVSTLAQLEALGLAEAVFGDPSDQA